MKNKLTSNIALFLTALIWGLSFVAQRAGMEYLGPFTFNAVRSLLGGISLLPLILFIKYSKPDTRSERRKHAQHINLTRAGAGKGGFISALYIIFVPIISILMGEKLKKEVIISVFLALLGLYLLCYKAGLGVDIYDILLLLSAFLYAVHIMVVNYYSRVVHPIKASGIQFFVVGFLSFILVLLFETLNLSAILACKIPLFFAGIVTCGIAYTLQIYGQKYTLPVLASLILCLESVFAVLGGVVILGETMTIKEILGCIFMISGVILSNLDLKHHREY